MKTQIVKFSYGTVKNASLKIPAVAYSAMDAARLIMESYLEYAFRPGCGLMSDECLTSSIGKSNFFAGALGGYENRVSAEVFELIKSCADNDIMLATMIVRARRCNAGISQAEVYTQASKNEALDESSRKALAMMAKNCA